MKKLLIIIIFAIFFTLFGVETVSLADTLALQTVITVDTETDSNEIAYQACTSDPNDCSLRGAISKSNAIAGGIGTIMVPTGTYQLTIAGASEVENATGDLNINQPVNIIGAGKGNTFIQAGPSKDNGLDRVFYIKLSSGSMSISDLTIRWGKISSGGTGGGGIYFEFLDSNLVLERVSVEGNIVSSSAPGGGIYSTGTLTIRDSTILDNSADSHEGGGIYQVGPLTAERVTISGNTAGTHGGAFANEGHAHLYNVTISGNSATTGGGGITQWNDGDLAIYNTTIANNIVTGGSLSGWAISADKIFYAYNSILSSGEGTSPCRYEADGGDHNIATTSSCGIGSTVADPLLGVLQDNGGLTLTHALLIGSPAIDAGDNTSCTISDQRGVIRRYDGDGNGSLICDIGAYEYNTGLTLYNHFAPLIMRP